MGLLDIAGDLLGGQSGGGTNAALLNAVTGMLASGSPVGGLPGLVQLLQTSGLGDVVGSWVGAGENKPVSAQQLQAALPSDMLAGLTKQLGGSQGDLLGQLSQMLPQLIDKLTPDGIVPEGGIDNVADLLGGLMKR